jgi:hypothetical protein
MVVFFVDHDRFFALVDFSSRSSIPSGATHDLFSWRRSAEGFFVFLDFGFSLVQEPKRISILVKILLGGFFIVLDLSDQKD